MNKIAHINSNHASDWAHMCRGLQDIEIDPRAWPHTKAFFKDWVQRCFEWDPEAMTKTITQYGVSVIVQCNAGGKTLLLQQGLPQQQTKGSFTYSFDASMRYGETPKEVALSQVISRLAPAIPQLSDKTLYGVETLHLYSRDPIKHCYDPFLMVTHRRVVKITLSDKIPIKESYHCKVPGQDEVWYHFTPLPC